MKSRMTSFAVVDVVDAAEAVEAAEQGGLELGEQPADRGPPQSSLVRKW